MERNENPQLQGLCNFNAFSAKYLPTKLNMVQYRMLYSDSYSDQLEKLDSDTASEIMALLIPLALYNLNCNLKFAHLLEEIDPTLVNIKSPIELFHFLFQNSELLLRAMYIHHYSFSNPIPFYYPILKAYTQKESIEYTLCKELWYSLTPHNAVMSFGIGSAADTPIGKSTFLDLVFELDFTANNPNTSCFHASSIDLRLTKNFFPAKKCIDYLTDWAFFDINGPTHKAMVGLLLEQIHIVIIHILEIDVINDLRSIENEMRSLNLKGKHVFICLRDANLEEKGNYFDSNFYNEIKVPKDRSKRITRKLKSWGKEIICLNEKIPKITAKNVDDILRKFDDTLSEEIMPKQRLVDMTNDAIRKSRTSNQVSYDFLATIQPLLS